METIKQYKVAEWLGVKPATLANIFAENSGVSVKEACRLSEISGVSFKDWMMSKGNGNTLRRKVFAAYVAAMQQAKWEGK